MNDLKVRKRGKDVKTMVRRALRAHLKRTGLTPRDVIDSTALPEHAVLCLLGQRRSTTLSLHQLYAWAAWADLSVPAVVAGMSDISWPDGFPAYADLATHVLAQLRRTRSDLGMSTRLLSELADVHQAYVSRLETGHYRSIDLVRVDRIAAQYSMTMEELLTPA